MPSCLINVAFCFSACPNDLNVFSKESNSICYLNVSYLRFYEVISSSYDYINSIKYGISVLIRLRAFLRSRKIKDESRIDK